ncbi:hypothetical protein PMI04_012065 [Sphingobium sp. AP49]|uniref:hypothetical protein n=1 Tax=Sphingobium sp. AP49 TaxID=1144307 RepID=UPI00026ED101|nr:hypothetical protein [Sphingobium sp. AP49]WHO37307.1 hypothetical protein PMI04_012065 [Sphingobium sp. AP49]
MKTVLFATALLLAGTTPHMAIAQAPATAPAPAYSIDSTDIGTLLDNPATKAVLDKNLPGFTANPQIDMARSMTLKGVQQYAPDQLSDAALAKVQADLNKVPAKK